MHFFKDQRGIYEVIILLAIVAISTILAGGIFYKGILDESTLTAENEVITTPVPQPADNSMQVGSFNIVATIVPLDQVTPTISIGTTQDILPSTNTCNGTYSLDMASNEHIHTNFGDPICDFSQSNLLSLLQQLDPENALFWYKVVAFHESQWDPNAWVHCYYDTDTHKDVCTPDPGGAWGLFQMGSSDEGPGSLGGDGNNGPLDRGDVYWKVQVYNAVSYRKQYEASHPGAGWTYWATACARWPQVPSNCDFPHDP